MIIRVIINVDTMHREDLKKDDRIFFHSVEYYTDEVEALRETDRKLDNYNLNDGCSLGSEEDFLALNAMLAERFDDPYNQDAYASWDDISDNLEEKIADYFREYRTDKPSGDALLKIAKLLEIDLEDL